MGEQGKQSVVGVWCDVRGPHLLVRSTDERQVPSQLERYHPGQERAFAEASGVLEQISTLADTVPYQQIFFFDLKH